MYNNFANTKTLRSAETVETPRIYSNLSQTMICEKQKENQSLHCLQVCLHFQLKSSCLSSSWVSNFTTSREVLVMGSTVTSVCLTPSPSSRINTAGGKRLGGSQWSLSVSHCLSPSVAFCFFILHAFFFPFTHRYKAERIVRREINLRSGVSATDG